MPAERSKTHRSTHRQGQRPRDQHCDIGQRERTLSEVNYALHLTKLEGLRGELVGIWTQAFYTHAAYGGHLAAKRAGWKAFKALARTRGDATARRHWNCSHARDPRSWERYGVCADSESDGQITPVPVPSDKDMIAADSDDGGVAGTSPARAIVIDDDDDDGDDNDLPQLVVEARAEVVVDLQDEMVTAVQNLALAAAPAGAQPAAEDVVATAGTTGHPFILRHFGAMKPHRGHHHKKPGMIVVPPLAAPYWAPAHTAPTVPHIQLEPLGTEAPKGWGLMCTRRLERGDLILREKPFLRVQHPITSDSVKTAFERLSPANRILFYSFLNTAPGTVDEYDGIAETNVIPCVREDERDKPAASSSFPNTSGIFENISRVNHSCSANAGWNWDEVRGQQALFARTTILPGEEITASYISDEDTILPFAERQRLLRDDFGFTCACLACRRGSRDNALLRICRDALETWDSNRYEDLVISQLHEAQVRTTIVSLRRLGRVSLLDRAYLQLFIYYGAWGKYANAIQAAKEVYEGLAGKFGWEEAERMPEALWARDPRSWEGWGSMMNLPSQASDAEDEDYHDGASDCESETEPEDEDEVPPGPRKRTRSGSRRQRSTGGQKGTGRTSAPAGFASNDREDEFIYFPRKRHRAWTED